MSNIDSKNKPIVFLVVYYFGNASEFVLKIVFENRFWFLLKLFRNCFLFVYLICFPICFHIVSFKFHLNYTLEKQNYNIFSYARKSSLESATLRISLYFHKTVGTLHICSGKLLPTNGHCTLPSAILCRHIIWLI